METNMITLPIKLILSSSSIRGFFIFHYADDFQEYLTRLLAGVEDGSIRSVVDNGIRSPVGPFKGIQSIPDAVEYMYSRKSQGKVMVEL